MFEPTRRLTEQLRGDVRLMPDMPDDESLPDQIRAVVSLLGSAAKIADCWVGVSGPVVISQLENLPLGAYMHPMAWMRIYGPSSKIAECFREAERQGLVRISDTEKGHYYEPTQALADILMAIAVKSTASRN